jgi:hypothetical protein
MFDQFDMFLESPAIAAIAQSQETPKAKSKVKPQPHLEIVKNEVPVIAQEDAAVVVATTAVEAPANTQALGDHPMVITELAIGEPAKRQGYLGKYRGSWLTLLVSAASFAKFTEEQKAQMQERLKNHLISGTV